MLSETRAAVIRVRSEGKEINKNKKLSKLKKKRWRSSNKRAFDSRMGKMVFSGSGISFGLLFLVSFRIIAVGSDDSSDFQKSRRPTIPDQPNKEGLRPSCLLRRLSTRDPSVPALLVWAVPGQDAELPCDVTAEKNDQVSMVLWFRDTMGIPVYSLDARGGPLEQAIHWAMSNDFGSRSNFLIGQGPVPSRLKISKVAAADEGIYRCRIDYNNSPTKNYKVNLTLIVQPSEPIIYDAQGREVIGVAGPFMEGYDLFLSCHVVGGRPRPKVTWWRDDELLDAEMETVTPSLVVNQYFRPNVSRVLYNSKLKCSVSVIESFPPRTKEVQVEVYLKPKWVKINVMSELLSSGRPQQYQCDTWGSVPTAKITWLLDGEPIKNTRVTVTQEVNLTTSVLTYRPAAEDDGKELTCRAENPRYPGSILEESMELTVLYPPSVSAKISKGVDVDRLREGDEVAFSCIIRSNPKPSHVSWFHGDMFVHHNPNAGVFVTEKGLQLENLTREQSGEYSCAARNSEGEARSDPVAIRVLFPPRCREEYRSRTVGALRRDTVTIRCEVLADPPDDVKFSWTFNNSGDVFRLPATRVVSSKLSSHVDFTPTADSDFGTLACWAANSIGRQTQPCTTLIFPARVPQSPKDCLLKNHTSGGIQLVCEAGHDGGLQQHFMLEVSEFHPGQGENSLEDKTDYQEDVPSFKVLGSEPEFVLRGLESGRLYTFSVYAVNGKGRSDPPFVLAGVRFGSSTARLTSTETMKNQDVGEDSNPMVIILGALIGIALLIVVAIATAAGLFLCRRKKPSENSFDDVFQTPHIKSQTKDAYTVPILGDNLSVKKVNNSARKSGHEILPLEDAAMLKPFHDSQTAGDGPTAVIRRNRGSAARQIRNSLSLSGGNHQEGSDCKPVPVEVKPVSVCAGRSSKVPEEMELAPLPLKEGKEEPGKKSYARVTLNPEGEVMKCVIEGAEGDS